MKAGIYKDGKTLATVESDINSMLHNAILGALDCTPDMTASLLLSRAIDIGFANGGLFIDDYFISRECA